MFSTSARAGENDSEFAHLQNTMSGKLLTVRISLQQVIDESNKFPVLENESGSSGDCTLEQQSNPFSDGLYSILGDMVDMLQQQVPEGETDTDTDTETESIASGKKRRRSSSISKQGPGRKLGWKQVLAPQRRLQPHWAEVMHREHARSHFGSEQKQARLKVFNNSIWDQVEHSTTQHSTAQHSTAQLSNQSMAWRSIA